MMINKIKFLNLIQNNKVLIAVSGGVDSMTLLFYINQMVNKKNIVVVHINYHKRGIDSEYEQKIVSDFCTTNNIKFYIFDYVDNKNIKNFQSNARDFRYNKFKEIYDKENIKYLLTAHNANDYIETYFIKRIQKRNQISNTMNAKTKLYDMNVLRPLINVFKNEIYLYANKNKVIWNEDVSNNTNLFLRNRIRHHLNQIEETNLNYLKQIKLEIEKKELKRDDTYISIFKTQVDQLKKLDDLNSNIVRSLNDKKIFVSKGFINEIKKIIFSSNNYLMLEVNEKLLITKNLNQIDTYSKREKYPDIIMNKKIVMYGNINIEYIGNKEINFKITKMQQGDKIKINGGHKKLSKFLIDKKIPKWERNDLIVIKNSFDEIIFVEKVYLNSSFLLY